MPSFDERCKKAAIIKAVDQIGSREEHPPALFKKFFLEQWIKFDTFLQVTKQVDNNLWWSCLGIVYSHVEHCLLGPTGLNAINVKRGQCLM